MVRENRIKNISFPVGSLTASSAGRFNVYSEQPFNGVIKKIQFEAGNYGANGSIFVNISGGVSEQILLKKGGTNADFTSYPLVYGVDNVNATGSPSMFTEYVGQSTIQLIGSGLGATKSGLGLTVYYI